VFSQYLYFCFVDLVVLLVDIFLGFGWNKI